MGVAHDPALSRRAIRARLVLVRRRRRALAGRALDGLVADDAAARLPHRRVLGFYRTPEPQRNWPAIRDRVARCAQHFRLLDRMLADRPFLAGNALSLADIPAGTSLYRYFELDIERPSVPNVEAWYRRLQDRPAYRTHVMVPFGELSGRLDP